MGKSKILNDKIKLKIISEELDSFNKIIKGHKNLLIAIGNL